MADKKKKLRAKFNEIFIFFSFSCNSISEFDKQYDSALARLMVRPADNWKGIGPNTLPVEAGFNPEPPIFAVKFALKENYSHILAIANEDGKVS